MLEIGGRKVGGESFALIAGPCTVESREQTLNVARAVEPHATMLRGGAFKPRSSPIRSSIRPTSNCTGL